MIPGAHITAWRSKAPWSTDAQVEQDLVICRAVVDLFDLSEALTRLAGLDLEKVVSLGLKPTKQIRDVASVRSRPRWLRSVPSPRFACACPSRSSRGCPRHLPRR